MCSYKTGLTAYVFSLLSLILFTTCVKDPTGSIDDPDDELSFVDTGIPVFWIETVDGEPITSKDDYLDGVLKVRNNQQYGEDEKNIELEIRGRGNTTWNMPKKPYRLRFKQDTEILELPATRNWVLLANYADKTLLRNYVAFELGSRMMDGFTPRSRFVEVYLNGEYQGSYHLTDQIRVEESRVDIDELGPSHVNKPDISGGYLLEVDARLDEEIWFHTDVFDVPVTFKDPEFPNEQQYTYITDYIHEFEEILSSPDFGNGNTAYEALIDVNSFVDWFIINEVLKNNDASLWSSVFLHKPRNGKLKIGPLWDFDIAAGNIDYNGNDNPEGWWVKTEASWYERLFLEERFRLAVKDRWNEVKNAHFDEVFNAIDQAAYETLHHSQQLNFERWPILDEWVWPNAVVTGSYEGEVEYMKEWLTARINWMDAEISNW